MFDDKHLFFLSQLDSAAPLRRGLKEGFSSLDDAGFSQPVYVFAFCWKADTITFQHQE